MYLYNAYYTYAQSHGFKPIARLNNYGLYQNSRGDYEIINLVESSEHYAYRYLVDAEAKLMELYKSEPLVIMADLEFCDLEYNDSILTNPTVLICEALASGRAVSIKPKL